MMVLNIFPLKNTRHEPNMHLLDCAVHDGFTRSDTDNSLQA